jgi:hypothetical protein
MEIENKFPAMHQCVSNPVTRNHSICQEQATERKILALIDGFIMELNVMRGGFALRRPDKECWQLGRYAL